MKAHPKIQTIVEAISRNEVVVALKDINSLLNKQQKSKDKLSPDILETITLLRGLCQVRTEQYGEARKILRDFFTANAKNTNIDPDIQAWLGYLASGTGIFDEIRAFFEPLKPKEFADEKAAVNQLGLVIKHYDFKGAQNAALRVYKDYKSPKYMLASIMCNYLAVVKGPNASKDIPKDLNLPCMFIVKLKDELKITEESHAIENILNRQVIKLYIEILFRQNKRDQVLEALKKFSRVFEDNYEVYFTYLLALYKENATKDVSAAILAKYTEIFRANNNLDTFRLCYNLYKQCIGFFFSNISKDTIAQSANIAIESAQNQAGQNNYEFTEDADFVKLLGIFWNSLGQSLQTFDGNFKEHQHYRNAVKAVLTGKLEILREILFVKKEQGKSVTEDAIVKEYVELLKLYTKHFLRIFTFADEVFPSLTLLAPATLDQYLGFLEQEVAQLPEKTRCIGDVNYLKLVASLKSTHSDIEEVEKEVFSLIGKYTEAMKIVYDNKKIVEKGERLDNDEYIVLLVDIVLKFLDKKDIQNIDEKTFGLVVKTLYILEIALEKTPYNFDLKVKAMQLYGRFSVTEKVLDIYKTTDIKAVQTDTLGYIFYNLHSSLYLNEPINDYIRDNIRFHVESQKESRESLMACIKHENLSSVEEFYEWDRLMQRSYFRHVCYLHYAEKELRSLLRKEAASAEASGEVVNQNFEFFLEHIFKRYNAQVAGDNFEKFTLNFDVKVPQRNVVVSAHTDERLTALFPVDTAKVGKTHIDYLTSLNNPDMLGLKAYRLDILYTIIQANETAKVERLQKVFDGYKETFGRVKLEGFFDLRRFERRTKDSALLLLDDKEGYEYSFIKEIVEFDLENSEFEIAFINLYSFWLDVIVKKEEKDGEAFIKAAEEKYEKVLANLEKVFQLHAKESWRIFMTDLRKLGRFIEETLETLVLVGAGIQNTKSAVNKVTKKFNDAKQFANLYKNTQTLLKTLKDRTDTTLEGINGILAEVGTGLKGNEGYLLKDYLGEVDKLFDGEVYNAGGHVRKNFVTETNRSFVFTISTFADRIKAQSKSLKSLVAN